MKLVDILLESKYKANQKLTQKLAEHYIQHHSNLFGPHYISPNLPRDSSKGTPTELVTAAFTGAMKKFNINVNQEKWLLTNMLEEDRKNVGLGKEKLLLIPVHPEAQFTTAAYELFGYKDNPLADSFQDHVAALFNNFDKYKNALPDKNIFNYNITKLVDAATTFVKKHYKDEQTTAEKLGFKRHLETPSFIIDTIDKYVAIADLPESQLKNKLLELSDSADIAAPFHNTSWCVKYHANFYSYSKDKPFLLIYRKPSLSKFGLLSSVQFKDPENATIVNHKSFKKFLEETADDNIISQYITLVYTSGTDFTSASDEAKLLLHNMVNKHLKTTLDSYTSDSLKDKKDTVDKLILLYRKTGYSEQTKELLKKTSEMDLDSAPITTLSIAATAFLLIPQEKFDFLNHQKNFSNYLRKALVFLVKENISSEDAKILFKLVENKLFTEDLEKIIATMPIELIERITERPELVATSYHGRVQPMPDIILNTYPENITIALNIMTSLVQQIENKKGLSESTRSFLPALKVIDRYLYNLMPEIIKTPRFKQLAKTYPALEIYLKDTENDESIKNFKKIVQNIKLGRMPSKEMTDSLLRHSLPLALELSTDYLGPWDELEITLREKGETELLNRYLEVYTPF